MFVHLIVQADNNEIIKAAHYRPSWQQIHPIPRFLLQIQAPFSIPPDQCKEYDWEETDLRTYHQIQAPFSILPDQCKEL